MNNIYRDISERTNGDIYIGVVGPVRSGKSTFVTNFVEKLVLPEIADKNDKARAIDELPQSADGKIIMTTQLKFVPNNAVKLVFDNKTTANVRLIDCVGFLIEGAEGHMDGEKMRLVNTPWSAEPIPFERAAEIGTQKVAAEHSTVAVVVTTDGTVGDLPRKNYVAAEEKTVKELKMVGKPFVIVLNCQNPEQESAQSLSQTLAEKYGVCVLPMNVKTASAKQLEEVLQNILREFPVRRLAINLPNWMRALSKDSKVIGTIIDKIKSGCGTIDKMKDCEKLLAGLDDCELLQECAIGSLDMGNGVANYNLLPKANLFFDVLSEEADMEISDEFSLMSYVTSAAYAKKRFENMKDALEQADKLGYGIVYPDVDKMALDEPEMVKQGNIYGVRLKATAPSYHIIRVDVATEVSPMVGSEQQSQYLLEEYKQNPDAIWNTNMFGKTMSGLAKEGLEGKCTAMPTEMKEKLTRTVRKIVNENRGGLICLLL
ncbi:MAG: stage IV sporulation protein A [Corallococcus sp.]|nr:stage IV sporulation protein A [Corallococcus sp.]MCM1359202.1 stage IV sporulation protein A [Corallococcus sp.]MCM1394592.1 stage IV sporulation protein A [Corallococcus sp.]